MFSKKKRKHKSEFYTIVLIPEGKGATQRVSVSRRLVHLGIFLSCIFFGTVVALSTSYVTLRAKFKDNERLVQENHGIRSEAMALAEKLNEVQSTLQKVDEFSDQVRAAAQLDPRQSPTFKIDERSIFNKEKKTKKSPVVTHPLGTELSKPEGSIGPLSPEEFEKFSNSNVNAENLEFKILFARLAEIENTGKAQAENLQVLLTQVKENHQRLIATPNIIPVRGWLSSNFGTRSSPIDGHVRMHYGVDISAAKGTPIRSTADGIVKAVRDSPDYGRYVEIYHGYGLLTRYAHTEAVYVEVGEKIKRGEYLAAVGSTGRSTGPHVHYEIELYGRKVNPMKYIQVW